MDRLEGPMLPVLIRDRLAGSAETRDQRKQRNAADGLSASVVSAGTHGLFGQDSTVVRRSFKRSIHKWTLVGASHFLRVFDCRLGVAQICNLPYRGIVFRNCAPCRQPMDVRRFADCKSAIQQITNLRYTADGSQPSALTLLKNRDAPLTLPACLSAPSWKSFVCSRDALSLQNHGPAFCMRRLRHKRRRI